MTKKRKLEVWCATSIALMLLVALAYLHWRREYGPPTEATLKFREALKNVDEVRVYDFGYCSTDACEAAQRKPIFVLRGQDEQDLINAIDFYEKASRFTVRNGGEMGDRKFRFVSGKQLVGCIYYDLGRKKFGDIELTPGASVDIGGGPRKRMDAYFLQLLQRHKSLTNN